MKLCVVSHPCFRGVNRRVYRELVGLGIEILVVAPTVLGGVAADPPAVDDPPLRLLPLTGANPRSYLFAGAEDVLADYRPDVILIEADPVSLLAVKLGKWARENGAKCMCLSVDNLDFGLWPHLRRTGIGSLPQVLAKNALHAAARPLIDAVFTISSNGTAVFQKHGYRNVVQVPLGFDTDLFHIDEAARARARAGLEIAPEVVTFGYFGRVVPQKGVHLIVEALGRLARSHPDRDWRLLLDSFDPVDYALQIERQIEQSGLSPRVVRFEANHHEVADYMRASDVVLLASLTTRTSIEQYGRVVPEAMACGALAIVSNSGAPKELVGTCGVVLPESDVGRLTTALQEVLIQPEKFAALRLAGAERARTQLSVQRQASIYADTMRMIVP